jgi:ribosomal protein S14
VQPAEQRLSLALLEKQRVAKRRYRADQNSSHTPSTGRLSEFWFCRNSQRLTASRNLIQWLPFHSQHSQPNDSCDGCQNSD